MTCCMPPFSRQRNKASGQSLRLQWRTFAADIMAVRLQTVIDATLMPLSPSSFVTFPTSPDSGGNLAYINGVFIGYIGTDSIGSLIKRFAAKKVK